MEQRGDVHFDKELYESLCSLPENLTNAPKEKLLTLWQRLSSLPKSVLEHPGRFMYNPVSALNSDNDLYLLGIHPGIDPNGGPSEKLSLRDEIREWSKRSTHAIASEIWSGHDYQDTVKVLCEKIGKDLDELCASNLSFTRAKGKPDLTVALSMLGVKDSVFWPVHEAVLDIVEPKCIIVIGAGKPHKIPDTVFRKVLHLMQSSKERPLLHTKEKTLCSDNKEYRWYVVDGEYQDRQMKLIGIPYPSHNRQLRYYEEVLEQIANEYQQICKK